MSLVTIAIPTFDRLEYLKEATASALAQTHREIEVLIGDDRPTRETEGWARGIMRHDSRVRYQPNPRNLGMAANWNALADSAQGEFIVILADDDRLLPDFVETLVKVAGPAANVAFANHYLMDSSGMRLEKETAECTRRYRRDCLPAGTVADARACVWQNSVPISASLMRTRDVRRLRFKEDLNTPEIEFFARLANEGGQFVFTPEFLAEYREHKTSATTRGLRSENLVKCLTPIKVDPAVEPYKREFMAKLVVDAVSRSLRLGDRALAKHFLRHEYYPRAPIGLKHAFTHRVQKFCAGLPPAVGCSAYRLMQRVKSAI